MGILNSLTFLHLFLLVEQDTWQENSLDGFLKKKHILYRSSYRLRDLGGTRTDNNLSALGQLVRVGGLNKLASFLESPTLDRHHPSPPY